MLEKANHSSLVDGVIEEIEKTIVDHTLEPGERASEERDGAQACTLAQSHVHLFHQYMEEKRREEQ